MSQKKSWWKDDARWWNDKSLWERRGHTRKPNIIVRLLYRCFDWIGDFFPMFGYLFRLTKRTAQGTWKLIVWTVLVLVNIAILAGIIYVSVGHSYDMLTIYGGMSGLSAKIFVAVWETVFIYCSLVIDVAYYYGKKSNWAAWAGFLMGWAFVEVSNVMGMADNWIGFSAGALTPILLLVMKKVLLYQFRDESQVQKKLSWMSRIFSFFKRKPDTENLDTKRPDVKPEIEKAGAEKPDIGNLDVKTGHGKPDVSKPEITEPDTVELDVKTGHEKPDTAEPDVEAGDVKLDTAKPDTKEAGHKKPEVKKPDTAELDVKAGDGNLDTAKPEAGHLDAEPDVTKLDVKKSDAEKPDVKSGDEKPEIEKPNTKKLDVKKPDAKKDNVVQFPNKANLDTITLDDALELAQATLNMTEETWQEMKRVLEYAFQVKDEKNKFPGRDKLKQNTNCSEYVAKEAARILNALKKQKAS